MRSVSLLMTFWLWAALQADGRDEATYLQRSAASWAGDLGHMQSAKRRAAAFALGKLGTHALGYVKNLRQTLLTDPDAAVRAAAAGALGELGALAGSEAIPPLIQAVEKEKTLVVRRAAVMSLGRLGDRAGAAEPVLRDCLGGTDVALRQNAAWALGMLGASAAPAVPALVERLSDADAGVRRDAALALGNLGSIARESIPALTKALQDKDEQVQESAILGLRQMGPLAAAGLPPLIELAESKGRAASLRQEALLTIEQVWPPGEKEPLVWQRLQRLAQEGEPQEVKAGAEAAIKRVGPLRQP